jgi:hypothetical protein
MDEVGLRRPLTAAAAVGLVAWACGRGTGTAPSHASAKPHAPLTISISVTNTIWNTAIPDDFLVTVTGGGFPSGVSIEGTEGAQQVMIELGTPYKIAVSGPEGYTEALSSGCTDNDPQTPATCTITEKEAPFGCDQALWDPVYRQDRLRVLSACESAVMTIASARIEPDGDADILADPDDRFRRLLGPGNDREAGGKLVIEIPCQGPVSQADAIGTCNGFKGTRIVPPLGPGERIVAAAHWVEDRNHGMQRELHGARVRRLPR